MSVKPIIYNTEMVRAILDGRKTATRIVIKLPEGFPKHGRIVGPQSGSGLYTIFIVDPDWELQALKDNKLTFKPPYEPGDILYVRETWSDHYVPDDEGNAKLEYCYKADGIDLQAECLPGEVNRWWPSIHMPKDAARIWLLCEQVAVEQLRWITDKEAIREGFLNKKDFLGAFYKKYPEINEETWVWTIEFERIEKPDEN